MSFRVGLLAVSAAQTITIDPMGVVTAVEGNNLTINCTDGVNSGDSLVLRENGVQLILANNTPPNEVNGVIRIFHLPVNRTKNGNMYDCLSLITAMESPVITLTVVCESHAPCLCQCTTQSCTLCCVCSVQCNDSMKQWSECFECRTLTTTSSSIGKLCSTCLLAIPVCLQLC